MMGMSPIGFTGAINLVMQPSLLSTTPQSAPVSRSGPPISPSNTIGIQLGEGGFIPLMPAGALDVPGMPWIHNDVVPIDKCPALTTPGAPPLVSGTTAPTMNPFFTAATLGSMNGFGDAMDAWVARLRGSL